MKDDPGPCPVALYVLCAPGRIVRNRVGDGEMNVSTETSGRAQLDDILLRTSQGKASFEELAEALVRLENLVEIIPKGEFARFMGDMDQALKEKGYGNVKVNDAEQSQVAGIRTEDGHFVPWVFTGDAIAREFAVAKGMIQPDEALSLITRPPDAVGCQGALGNGGRDRNRRFPHLAPSGE
jgi:hypothetical protein